MAGPLTNQQKAWLEHQYPVGRYVKLWSDGDSNNNSDTNGDGFPRDFEVVSSTVILPAEAPAPAPSRAAIADKPATSAQSIASSVVKARADKKADTSALHAAYSCHPPSVCHGSTCHGPAYHHDHHIYSHHSHRLNSCYRN